MSVWYTLLKPISLGTASYTRGGWVESSHRKTILEQWSIELNYAHKECKVTSSGKTGKNEKGIQRSAIYGRENLRIHTLLPEFTHWRLGGCDANQHCLFRPHHRVTELRMERGYWPFVQFSLSESAIVLFLCLNSSEAKREGLKIRFTLPKCVIKSLFCALKSRLFAKKDFGCPKCNKG